MSLLRRIAAAVFSAASFSAAGLSAMAVIVVLTRRLPHWKSVVVMARATRAKCRGPPATLRLCPVQPFDRALAKATPALVPNRA